MMLPTARVIEFWRSAADSASRREITEVAVTPAGSSNPTE